MLQEPKAAGVNFYLSQATLYAASEDGCVDRVDIADLYARLRSHPSSDPALTLASLLALAERSGSSLHQSNLWLNAHRATVSALHYDEYHNLLHVHSGKKSVLLLAPQHTPMLQALPVSKDSCNRSRLGKQELLRLINTPCGDGSDGSSGDSGGGGVYEVEVCAGEVLFIPEGFWHLVTSGIANPAPASTPAPD